MFRHFIQWPVMEEIWPMSLEMVLRMYYKESSHWAVFTLLTVSLVLFSITTLTKENVISIQL